ncbi:MAG TPA: DUF4382 domain-containing protein, partial [Bacteroidales bacterium]|nr:DUF4382 domain-containing protein [Bacteroidales bacterium]
ILMLVLVLALAVISCKKDEGPDFSGTSTLTFKLTDAPGDFDKVNIDIQGLEVIIDDTVLNLDVNKGVYNLLDLANGKDTLLVTEEVPAGKVSQIRLILGDNNTVVIGENEYKLNTPSAQQSGLKLNVHANFERGVAYEYVLDFDAARSIVETGSGKYNLKPVIKVFTKAVTGAIKGVVAPAASKPVIYAISAAKDTVATVADETTGRFMFMGLNEGTYNLSMRPVTPYHDTLIANIQVKTGYVTTVDTVRFK